MGLRDDIAAAVTAAFDTDLADAVQAFTGSRFVPSMPADPISQTQPGSTVTYDGRGVFGSFSNRVVDGLRILRTDIKLTALQAEVSEPPQVDDVIQRSGKAYKVMHVEQDAAGVTWTVQLRGD